jgi:Holliday junction DNA helicase RuvA
VGYLITLPLPVWDGLQNDDQKTIITYHYIREDRCDLFGFLEETDRELFVEFLNLSGIGPKTALELAGIPRDYLIDAAKMDDVTRLQKIKGIGKKTAEKLLVDLKQLLEKHPEWTVVQNNNSTIKLAPFDNDAIAALLSLGYQRTEILDALKKIPSTIERTEDRVSAVLRML